MNKAALQLAIKSAVREAVRLGGSMPANERHKAMAIALEYAEQLIEAPAVAMAEQAREEGYQDGRCHRAPQVAA
jgi:hypothetical protein